MVASTLTADKQIAILLLSIDEELAARVLRNIGEDHLDSLTRAMKELQELSVEPTTIGEVYELLVQRMKTGGMALGDVGRATWTRDAQQGVRRRARPRTMRQARQSATSSHGGRSRCSSR